MTGKSPTAVPDNDTDTAPVLPAAVVTVLAFVNSRAKGGNQERLGDGPALVRWAREHAPGVLAGQGDELLTHADAAAARELRAALITVLLAHAGEAEPEALAAAEQRLAAAGRRCPLAPVVTASGVGFAPAQGGAAAVLGHVLAAVAGAAADGTWPRLKACRNPGCGKGFYDRTRNGSGTYCTPARCGAQVAARAYRARKSQARG